MSEPQVVNQDLAPAGAVYTPMPPSQGIQRVSDEDLLPRMVCDVSVAKARLAELQEFIDEAMIEGVDFGLIPGTQKKSLFKPGAEKLLEIYGYVAKPWVHSRIEDWKGQTFGVPFFAYEVYVEIYSKRTGAPVSFGMGSCNSREDRYRWRDAKRKCPKCGMETIFKSKNDRGGWYCFTKKGGCGENFRAGDPTIEDQKLGRAENEDIYTLVNTILKMAEKRAVIDAAIRATRSSGMLEEGDDDDKKQGDDPDSSRGSNTATGTADHQGRTKVQFRNETLWTKGVTAGTLLRLRSLSDQVDKAQGAGAAAKVLQQKTNQTSDVDLTDDEANQVIAALQAQLTSPASAEPKPAAAPAQGAKPGADQDPLFTN